MRTRSLTWLCPLLSTSLLREFSPGILRGVSDLILRAAAQRHSIAQARHRSRRGVSERHSQRVLEHLDRRKTQRALTLALRKQVAPYLPHHPMDVALDFHEIPYYGKPIDPKHPQFVKTKEERGTHRAYRYATLSIVVHGFRFTLSVRYLDHRGRLAEVLTAAFRDAEGAGVQVRRVYLDREFAIYDVVAWMRERGYTTIFPLRLGSRQKARFERGQKSYVSEHTLRDSKRKRPPLTFRVHVVVRYQMGKKWNKHGAQYLVYGVLGHVPLEAPHDVPLRRTHELYRARFGIESSFRIAGQARPRTCTRSVPWRLLYLGVALMLENEWSILRLLYTSEGRQGPGGMVLREELLRFADVLELLLLGINRVLGTVRCIGNPKPPPLRLKRWGMVLS